MSKVTDKQSKEIRRLIKMADEDIDTSELPEVDDFTDAVRGRFYRPVKQQITLRLDADLLAWFRSQGGKYQTRINAALREYMESHREGRMKIILSAVRGRIDAMTGGSLEWVGRAVAAEPGSGADDLVDLSLSTMARTRRKSPTPAPVLQLRIELDDIEPLVWRRVLVPANITLGRLHRVIQAAMGWTDSHLHEFVIDGQHYGNPDLDDDVLPYQVIAETRARLLSALNGRRRFDYLYDFGDSWEHLIRVEKTLAPVPMKHPMCVAGAQACPPEDVGGYPGYAEFVLIMGDPAHPEHGEMLDWYGGAFDPSAFDVDQANRMLAHIRL